MSTYIFPFGVNDVGWAVQRRRSPCCDLIDALGFDRMIVGAYTGIGSFHGDPGDASTQKGAVDSLYGSTSPITLAAAAGDDPVDGAYHVSESGTPTPNAAVLVAGDYTDSDGVGGGLVGECPWVNSDFAGMLSDPAKYSIFGGKSKQAIRFRLALSPAWRDIDIGPIKVVYRLDTRLFEKVDPPDDPSWQPVADPEEGDEIEVELHIPATDATVAIGDWIAVNGSAGVQTYVTLVSAKIGEPCLGDEE